MDNSHLLCKCGSSSDFLLCFCAHLSLNGGRNRHFGSPFWGPFNRFIFEESKACKVQSPFKIQSQLHSYEISIDFLQNNANQNGLEKGKEIECRRKVL